MNYYRILAGFMISLGIIAGSAKLASASVGCTIPALTKTLEIEARLKNGEALHLPEQSWWNKCPDSIRMAAWKRAAPPQEFIVTANF